MTANRLLPIDIVAVEAAADIMDVALRSLQMIDHRHYYGDVKGDTKRKLYSVEEELREQAWQLRKLADDSRLRIREQARKNPPLRPFEERWP